MKRLLAVLLAVLFVCTAFAVPMSASAADDDGWTTVTSDIMNWRDGKNEKVGSATVSAKGNDIKIVLNSDWINGDAFTCPGTEECEEHPDFGAADGRFFYLTFSDRIDEEDKDYNVFELDIRHECGEHTDAHTVSLSKDCRISLHYQFLEDDGAGYGNTSYGGPPAPGYEGYLASGIEHINVELDGHTMTATMTLPDQVVDYKNEDARDLHFRSENLQVSGLVGFGCWYHVDNTPVPEVPEEELTPFQKFIKHVREVFEKFFAIFRRIFHIQTAETTSRKEIKRYVRDENGWHLIA